MTRDDLTYLLSQQPFIPLLVLTADGERTIIQSIQYTNVTKTTLEVGMGLDQYAWPTITRYINLNQITMIEPMSTGADEIREGSRDAT